MRSSCIGAPAGRPTGRRCTSSVASSGPAAPARSSCASRIRWASPRSRTEGGTAARWAEHRRRRRRRADAHRLGGHGPRAPVHRRGRNARVRGRHGDGGHPARPSHEVAPPEGWMTGRQERQRWLLIGAIVGLSVGGALWLAGQHAAANAVWAITTVIGGVPLLIDVVAVIVHGRFGVDVIAALAIVGRSRWGEYLAGAVIALMLSTGEVAGGLRRPEGSPRAVGAARTCAATSPSLRRRRAGRRSDRSRAPRGPAVREGWRGGAGRRFARERTRCWTSPPSPASRDRSNVPTATSSDRGP